MGIFVIGVLTISYVALRRQVEGRVAFLGELSVFFTLSHQWSCGWGVNL